MPPISHNMILHNYFRSSSSYRVRIALAMKGIAYDYAAYHLRKGEQRGARYLGLNPQGLVPTLELPTGEKITQSLAILEYLEETHPDPPLLPKNALGRARVRALAQAVALEIHPINNLRVLADLRTRLFATDAQVNDWFRHWVAETFVALEAMLAADTATGRFCHGDQPTIADICLVPQVLNNRRFEVDMTPYPTIQRIFDAGFALPAFRDAAPDRQPDRE